MTLCMWVCVAPWMPLNVLPSGFLQAGSLYCVLQESLRRMTFSTMNALGPSYSSNSFTTRQYDSCVCVLVHHCHSYLPQEDSVAMKMQTRSFVRVKSYIIAWITCKDKTCLKQKQCIKFIGSKYTVYFVSWYE